LVRVVAGLLLALDGRSQADVDITKLTGGGDERPAKSKGNR
jgi:hypothetical protein